MKILQVIDIEGYGGAQTAARMVESYCNNKCGLSIFTYPYMNDKTDSKIKAIKWLKIIFFIYYEYLRFRPQVAVAHSLFSLYLLWPLSFFVKTVYCMHGPMWLSGEPRIIRLFKRIKTYLLVLTLWRVVLVSAEQKKYLPKGNFLASRIIVINNPPSERFFEENIGLYKKFSYLAEYNGKRVIHFGRFDYQKNQIFSVNLLKSAKDAGVKLQIVFFGDGDYRDSFVSLAEESGLKICYEGDCPGSEFDLVLQEPASGLASVMNLFDISLFPSRFEGFPLSIIESLCTSTPVFSSACDTGPREIYSQVLELSKGKGYESYIKVLESDIDSVSALGEWTQGLIDFSPSKNNPEFADLIMSRYSKNRFSEEWLSLFLDKRNLNIRG